MDSFKFIVVKTTALIASKYFWYVFWCYFGTVVFLVIFYRIIISNFHNIKDKAITIAQESKIES